MSEERTKLNDPSGSSRITYAGCFLEGALCGFIIGVGTALFIGGLLLSIN